MKNTSTKSEHRRNVICTIVLLIASSLILIRHASESRWFLKRQELTGVFEYNEDQGDRMHSYHYRYGKLLFRSDDGQTIAIRDNYLAEVNDQDGKNLWVRDRGRWEEYPIELHSRATINGVLYQINELQAEADQQGGTLFYPEAAEALFDVESITWLED